MTCFDLSTSPVTLRNFCLKASIVEFGSGRTGVRCGTNTIISGCRTLRSDGLACILHVHPEGGKTHLQPQCNPPRDPSVGFHVRKTGNALSRNPLSTCLSSTIATTILTIALYCTYIPSRQVQPIISISFLIQEKKNHKHG
jgi:hypothetical protein